MRSSKAFQDMQAPSTATIANAAVRLFPPLRIAAFLWVAEGLAVVVWAAAVPVLDVDCPMTNPEPNPDPDPED